MNVYGQTFEQGLAAQDVWTSDKGINNTVVFKYRFYINCTNNAFTVQTAPYFSLDPAKGGFELQRVFNASDQRVLDPYQLPPIENWFQFEPQELVIEISPAAAQSYVRYSKTSN